MPVRYNSPQIPTNGLITAYDAINTKSYVSGSNTVRDLIGNVQNATIQGSLFYSQKYSGGLRFLTSTPGETIADTIIPNLITTGCTVSVWIEHSSLKLSNNTYMRYVSVYNVSPNADDIILRHSYTTGVNTNGGVEAIVFTSGTPRILSVNNMLSLNTPTHLVMTWNGGTLLVYKNGVQVGTLTPGGTYSPTSTKRIGLSSNTVESMDGQIYSTLVYNRALSATEVLQLFNVQRTRFKI